MDALLQSRAQELATEFASQATTVEELNELMRLMMKSGLERMLDAELDVHLGRRSGPAAATAAGPTDDQKKRSPNRRNGRSRKTVQGDLGEVTLSTPRDRPRHVRAAAHREASAPRAGVRREDFGPLRQGDDHAGHPRDCAGTVWR